MTEMILAGLALLFGVTTLALWARRRELELELEALSEENGAQREALEHYVDLDRVVYHVRAIVHRFWEDQHRHLLWETETGPEAMKSAFGALGEIENLLVVFDQYGTGPLERIVLVTSPHVIAQVMQQFGPQALGPIGDDEDPPETDGAPVR